MSVTPGTRICPFQPRRQRRASQVHRPPGAVSPPPCVPLGRVPRVARLLALALRFQGLLQQGLIADYATLARLGHVSRARITQIMNLAVLAPDNPET